MFTQHYFYSSVLIYNFIHNGGMTWRHLKHKSSNTGKKRWKSQSDMQEISIFQWQVQYRTG